MRDPQLSPALIMRPRQHDFVPGGTFAVRKVAGFRVRGP